MRISVFLGLLFAVGACSSASAETRTYHLKGTMSGQPLQVTLTVRPAEPPGCYVSLSGQARQIRQQER